MQSTGQTSTHALSLVPTHGSQMIYATDVSRNNSLQPVSIARSLAAAAAAILFAVLPAGSERTRPTANTAGSEGTRVHANTARPERTRPTTRTTAADRTPLTTSIAGFERTRPA